MGMKLFVRVLFDTASEVNLITRCMIYANLPRKRFTMELEGITGLQLTDYIAMIKISPWYEQSDDY